MAPEDIMQRKTSTLLSIGISAALVAAAIWFLFNHHADIWWRGGFWPMPHGMMTGRGGMGLLMALFWGLVITALVFLLSAALSGRRVSAGESALEILRKRYARGEIDKESFEAMRRDLERR
jgi:putative membrane protein